MSPLADQVLRVLGRGAITHGELLAELSADADSLDEALDELEDRVEFMGGKIYLRRSIPAIPEIARIPQGGGLSSEGSPSQTPAPTEETGEDRPAAPILFHIARRPTPTEQPTQEMRMATRTCKKCGKTKDVSLMGKTGRAARICLACRDSKPEKKTVAAAAKSNGGGQPQARYGELLTELRTKRAALDQAIAAIEALG
ncbi:MAG: hypothetical protein JSR67_03845 [Proteobacteria bacterium]|nr:hypothetical protein [Pseudomonadota bacterium]